jgi:hypothetical protein
MALRPTLTDGLPLSWTTMIGAEEPPNFLRDMVARGKRSSTPKTVGYFAALSNRKAAFLRNYQKKPGGKHLLSPGLYWTTALLRTAA